MLPYIHDNSMIVCTIYSGDIIINLHYSIHTCYHTYNVPGEPLTPDIGTVQLQTSIARHTDLYTGTEI